MKRQWFLVPLLTMFSNNDHKFR